MSAPENKLTIQSVRGHGRLATDDGNRDAEGALKERLDDALRRLATLQQDIKEIRREITTTRR
jgi:hypothetical protein